MGLLSRVARLEKRREGPDILSMTVHESGLSSPEFHWQRALARATPDELAELERCRDAAAQAREEGASETGAAIDPRWEPYLEMYERIMRREADTLADDIRVRRDGLWRELNRLAEGWREEGRHKGSTSQSDPIYWHTTTAETNRRTSVSRGAALVCDPEDIKRRIDLICDEDATIPQILKIIDWR